MPSGRKNHGAGLTAHTFTGSQKNVIQPPTEHGHSSEYGLIENQYCGKRRALSGDGRHRQRYYF